MPGRNGTGPMGQGPLTGRGLGPCGGGYAYGGRAFYGGGRMGMGRGMRAGRFYPNYTPDMEYTQEEQKDILIRRKEYLEQELNALQKNIDEL